MSLNTDTRSELENLITESHVVFLMKLATYFLLLNNEEKTKLVMKLQEMDSATMPLVESPTN